MLFNFSIQLMDTRSRTQRKTQIRTALHPAESVEHLVLRVLAYALNEEPGIEFSPGVCRGDLPAIAIKAPDGSYKYWIEVGAPSAHQLQKAVKTGATIRVYGYRGRKKWMEEMRAFSSECEEAGRTVEVYLFSSSWIGGLAEKLESKNEWNVQLFESEIEIFKKGPLVRL